MLHKILTLGLLLSVLELDVVRGVKVSIYYDILQTASQRMFMESVVPGYKKLSPEVDFEVELVPFTKTEDATQCPLECIGNKIQACTLVQNKKDVDKFEFVNCASKQQNPADIFFIKICINYWGFDYENVTSCMNSEEGEGLMKENFKRASQYIPSLVLDAPVIVFDDKFDADTSTAAVLNFFYGACKALNYLPKICSIS